MRCTYPVKLSILVSLIESIKWTRGLGANRVITSQDRKILLIVVAKHKGVMNACWIVVLTLQNDCLERWFVNSKWSMTSDQLSSWRKLSPISAGEEVLLHGGIMLTICGLTRLLPFQCTNHCAPHESTQHDRWTKKTFRKKRAAARRKFSLRSVPPCWENVQLYIGFFMQNFNAKKYLSLWKKM